MASSNSSSKMVFREYIGHLDNGVNFTDVPIKSGVEFHFILAFAVDVYPKPQTQESTNGKFNVFWDRNNLTSEAIANIKHSHKDLKVALSLGGPSVDVTDVVFTVNDVNSWVANAVSSLTPIIREYHIDGIDIDYEAFQPNSVNTFAECIGKLITALKHKKVISFASIAPYDDPTVQRYYMRLWQKYSSVIDYVNFQFYQFPSLDVEKFLEHYDHQLVNYKGGNVLASFCTDGFGGLTPANGFFRACAKLKGDGKLRGIFAWSADTSFEPAGNGFIYEEEAQDLLAS